MTLELKDRITLAVTVILPIWAGVFWMGQQAQELVAVSKATSALEIKYMNMLSQQWDQDKRITILERFSSVGGTVAGDLSLATSGKPR